MDTEWLDEHLLIGERLGQQLDLVSPGTNPQRAIVLHRLAEEMEFNTNTLGQAAYDILDELVRQLGALMDRDRGRRSLIDDLDSGEVDRIVDEAVKQPYLDDVVAAMIQFGRGAEQIDTRSLAFRDLDGVARAGLARVLKQRIVAMLTRWYSTRPVTHRSRRRERV